MFGRKKKARRKGAELVLLDGSMREISVCPVREYVLPEKVVLALSVEYFNDPEPCEIHRGAVHNRVMMELMESIAPGTTRPLGELPEEMHAWFPAETAYVRIAE